MSKIVIVGGVAGGASAAARIRRLDETAEIIMFEKDEYISFANCGLPYHIGQSIKERSKLIVQTPAAMRNRFCIDVRNFSVVTAVNSKNKTVTVHSKDKGEYTESYDTLVLAPGVVPSGLPIENPAHERTFSLRTIPDTDSIKETISRNNVKAVAVIGGGFIGVEIAENLAEIGVNVSLIEAAPHVMAPFDSELSVLLEKEMRKNGVELHLNSRLKTIEELGTHAILTTEFGEKITAQMIISAVGVTPATSFLKDSGIELAARGHIVTNSRMQTNIANVYAVGDAVQTFDFVTKGLATVPLAGPANKQGRIAGDNICGIERHYGGTQGSSVLKVFELTAACTGTNECTLKRLNIPYTAIYTHPFSHATYYPGAAQMSCKLLFAPDGKILGCQIVGEKGVEKRVDVVATAIRLGGHVCDLCELELSYAPPYSSAKDPVNMLGYIAQNIIEGNESLIDYNYIIDRDRENTVLLDVRTDGEFAGGHIEGTLHIPVDDLRNRLSELEADKEILVYCAVGIRGHIAQRILAQNGHKAKNLSGGYKTWNSLK